MPPAQRPLCFVLMPFGQKKDATGGVIDFDRVYREIIAPAIEEAGLETLRADEETSGGMIHKAMFERLVLCEYAVADLTTANPNVFYELGVRHAVRPWSTVLLFAERGRLPFDLSSMRGIPYHLADDGSPADAPASREVLTGALKAARHRQSDSPVFQLVDGMAPPILDHQKTDLFRVRARYSENLKGRLSDARRAGLAALRELARELEPISECEAGVVVDLFLSYRSLKAWDDMIGLVDLMSPPLAGSVLVQEQMALALNRAGRGERAEEVLKAVIAKRGPSSETLGLLGRVYKDRWERAVQDGESPFRVRGLLDKAIAAYLEGFETDWRDAYPGINAVTLMEIREPPDPRMARLVPIVTYAAERDIARGKADYWSHATIVELGILGRDREKAEDALGTALASVREPWEPETTARNLRLICEVRERRGTLEPWMREIQEELERRGRQ